eukprot:5773177-Pleurochrysis_carterae.AAC.1
MDDKALGRAEGPGGPGTSLCARCADLDEEEGKAADPVNDQPQDGVYIVLTLKPNARIAAALSYAQRTALPCIPSIQLQVLSACCLGSSEHRCGARSEELAAQSTDAASSPTVSGAAPAAAAQKEDDTEPAPSTASPVPAPAATERAKDDESRSATPTVKPRSECEVQAPAPTQTEVDLPLGVGSRVLISARPDGGVSSGVIFVEHSGRYLLAYDDG